MPRRRAHVHALALALAFATPIAAQDVASGGQAGAAEAERRALSAMLAALPRVEAPPLDEVRAIWLATLPLACMDRVQPRPTSRPYFWIPTARLVDDHERARAFWGCNDWASAVSSTWAAVRMLKGFPADMDVLARERLDELAREKLTSHLGRQNFEGELAFFREAGQFQRPYGYAWLLKLQSELLTWPDSAATDWAANAAPLAAWMSERLTLYLAQLERPVRTGGQTNTARVIALALDYADAAADAGLRTALRSSARKFYMADRDCDTQAEAAAVPGGRGGRGAAAPGARGGAGETGGRGATGGREGGGRGGGGADVVSPCLAEAALMARVLEPAEFVTWLNGFLPPLHSDRFAPLTQPPDSAAAAGRGATPGPGEGRAGGEGGGREGGRGGGGPTGIARLAGLSLQRAEAMERIARALPSADPRGPVLRRLSALHAVRAFELARDDASGTHWVPAFAVLYFTAGDRMR